MRRWIKVPETERSRSPLAGPILGVLAFLVGLALLGFTFKLAWDLFGVEPAKLFDIQPGKTLDFQKVGTMLLAVFVKVLLLFVMALVGGVFASRGIRMYADGRAPKG